MIIPSMYFLLVTDEQWEIGMSFDVQDSFLYMYGIHLVRSSAVITKRSL